jgi:predicted nucleic acid-binding protein
MTPGFLIDTNLLSELRKPQPHSAVLQFFDDNDTERLFVSEITMAEIRFGAELRSVISERMIILNWLEAIIRPLFVGRELSTSEDIWLAWKLLEHDGRRTGYTYPQPDLVIAAIALHHGLTMVTRDAEPFTRAGVPVYNPWEDASS